MLVMRESGQWLTPEEIQQYPQVGYIAGILLQPGIPVRFAQVSIAAGAGRQARWEPSGRLFRFGVDRAAYFRPARPGTYTIHVRTLGARGWTPATVCEIEIAPRPVCQEFTVSLSGFPVPLEPSGDVESLPLWIR